MGEVSSPQPREQDIQLSIRVKQGEAHTHRALARDFEARATEHLEYATSYETEIAKLQSQLARGAFTTTEAEVHVITDSDDSWSFNTSVIESGNFS